MVNISIFLATIFVIDSVLIFIEANTSLNLNGDRALYKSLFAIIVFINLEDLNGKSALFDLATAALDSDVRVMSFSHLTTSVQNASEGSIGIASIATHIKIAAVDHLLLRELNLIAISD